MPYFKCTWVMSWSGYGWTESLTLNAATGTTLTAAIGYASSLFPLRQALNGLGPNIDYLRVSALNQRYATQTIGLIGPGTYPANADVPQNSLLLRCSPTIAGPNKSIFLRGVPASINNDGNYEPTAAFTKAFQAWTGALLNPNPLGATWGWIGVLASPAGSPTTALTGYTLNTDTTVTITAATNITTGLPFWNNVTPGTIVTLRLSGVNGKSALNGTGKWTVNTSSTATSVDQIALKPYSYGGRIEWPSFAFTQLNSIQAMRFTSRKCGKELFLERGRQQRKTRA